MTQIRYVFGTLSDRQIVAELSLQGVSMSSVLNDWGTFRATVRLDASGVSNLDVINATVPGKCFVVAERDGTVLWDGILWSRTYDSLAKDLQLTAREAEAYPDRVTMDDYSFTADPRNIMRDLWSTLQAQPYCHLGIVIPAVFTTMSLVPVEALATDEKSYFTAMTSVADGEDNTGFDWKIRTTKDGDTYRRVLSIGSPLLGSSDPSGMSFEYPGNIFNYWKTDGMSAAGTNLAVIGDGDGSGMVVGRAVQQDLLDTGFPRYDLVISRKDITDQSLIDAMATRLGAQRRPPLSSIKIQVKGDAEPIFGSYGLGDSSTTSIMDARHPLGFQTTTRLVAWEYHPASDDTVEDVQLVFEGDELNE